MRGRCHFDCALREGNCTQSRSDLDAKADCSIGKVQRSDASQLHPNEQFRPFTANLYSVILMTTGECYPIVAAIKLVTDANADLSGFDICQERNYLRAFQDWLLKDIRPVN